MHTQQQHNVVQREHAQRARDFARLDEPRIHAAQQDVGARCNPAERRRTRGVEAAESLFGDEGGEEDDAVGGSLRGVRGGGYHGWDLKWCVFCCYCRYKY